MRKLVLTLLLSISLLLSIQIQPATADTSPDLLAKGTKVFSANCAACHMNGGNVVAANKNLKQDTLKQYGMDSLEAIVTQVTNGKGVMPAFKTKLKPDDIQAVAAYVLTQAEKGWKG
jgi:cytochrome c6